MTATERGKDAIFTNKWDERLAYKEITRKHKETPAMNNKLHN